MGGAHRCGTMAFQAVGWDVFCLMVWMGGVFSMGGAHRYGIMAFQAVGWDGNIALKGQYLLAQSNALWKTEHKTISPERAQ